MLKHLCDERQKSRRSPPRPYGLLRISGHTLLSAMIVDPPQSAASASSRPIFASNAVRSNRVNRRYAQWYRTG
jgi:hypothetical protein